MALFKKKKPLIPCAVLLSPQDEVRFKAMLRSRLESLFSPDAEPLPESD